MQIIREILTQRALYLIPDGEPVMLDTKGLRSNSVTASDIRSGTHEIIEGPAPELWVAGALSYNAGVWSVLDQEAVTAAQEYQTAQNRLALRADIVQQTQARLDHFAQTRNYDSIMSACTYASSSIPKFAAEGQYAVSIRDATWAALYALLADVQSGAAPMPASFTDVVLPELVWPT